MNQSGINRKSTGGGGGGTWGSITGTLSNQTDLAAALAAKQAALGFTPEDVANKSPNTSLGTSDTLYPTQKAVKTYVDASSGLVQRTIATLSAADLKLLSTVPFELLAAPGAGKYYLVLAASGIYLAGTTVFNDGLPEDSDSLQVVYTDGNSLAVEKLGQGSDFEQLVDKIQNNTLFHVLTNTSDVFNKPLKLTPQDPTLGGIKSSTLDNGGANWKVGDLFVVGGTSLCTVDTVSAGAVVTYTITLPGVGVATGVTPGIPPTDISGIRTAVVNNGGLGYAPGDTVSVDGAGSQAVLTIDTVGALGVVTAFTLTSPGLNYAVANGVSTTALTGVGTGLTVDITEILGSGLTIDVTEIQFLLLGDGTFKVVLVYAIVDTN